MRTRKFLLNVDLTIQNILFFGTILCGFLTGITIGAFGFFLLYFLLFLGIWQLASGVIMGFILEDGKRAKYFFGSIFYLTIIIAVSSVLNISNELLAKFLILIFYVLIPLLIAFWYLKLTSKSLTKIKNLENGIKIPEEMNDVLDSEEIFKPIKNS